MHWWSLDLGVGGVRWSRPDGRGTSKNFPIFGAPQGAALRAPCALRSGLAGPGAVRRECAGEGREGGQQRGELRERLAASRKAEVDRPQSEEGQMEVA